MRARSLFDNGGRQDVQGLLAEYMPKQRWFGEKSRSIVDANVTAAIDLMAPDPAHRRLFLTPVNVRLDDGSTRGYMVPLGVATGPVAAAIMGANPKAALGMVRLGAQEALLYDAMADDEAPRALVRLMARERALSGGTITAGGHKTHAYHPVDAKHAAVKRGSAEQSNTSMAIGTEYMLKLFRRRSEGINRDYKIGRYLTEEARSPRVPHMAGAVELVEGGRPSTLAILQERIATQGDAWEFALEASKDYVSKASRSTPRAAREAARSLAALTDAAHLLGERTAELHLDLGGATDPKSEFVHEPLTLQDLGALQSRMRSNLARVVGSVRAKQDTLPKAMRPVAADFLARAEALSKMVDAVSSLSPDAFTKTVCHGDYHLGQVLLDETGRDFKILDFEGEPAATKEEQDAKAPGQKDVAGMIRSFDYAAHAGRREVARAKPGVAEAWSKATSSAFLDGYVKRMGLNADQAAAFRQLLSAYLLDKALYEAAYELDNRPNWLDIPLGALVRLTESSKAV